MPTVILSAELTNAIIKIGYELERMNDLKKKELELTGKFLKD